VTDSTLTAAQRAAAVLRAMADDCERNDTDRFAGAFVIVPPEGEPMEFLFMNNRRDTAAFFTALGGQVKQAVDEIDQERKNTRARGY